MLYNTYCIKANGILQIEYYGSKKLNYIQKFFNAILYTL